MMKFDLSKIKLSKNDEKRSLFLPDKPSKELAEFIGILTGDGYLNYYPYQSKYLLEIAGDSRLDKHYLNSYVKNLIKRLFNIESSFFIRNDQNSMYLRLISKGLVTYLIKIGFKKGKKEQIGIPKWITSNRNYMVSFLKGVADTDFSIHFRKNYPIISFGSKSKMLTKIIFNFLKDEGFQLKNYYKEKKIDKRGYNDSITYSVKLNGEKNLVLWLYLIAFRNKRHLYKIKKWGGWNLNPGFRTKHLVVDDSPTSSAY